MNLSRVLETLRTKSDTFSSWKVVAVSREKTNDPETAIVQQEHWIVDVSADHEACEVDLITTKSLEGKPDKKEGLTFIKLLQRLEALSQDCGEYELFSASSHLSLDKEYSVRLDVPIVAIGSDPDRQLLAFIEAENEE